MGKKTTTTKKAGAAPKRAAKPSAEIKLAAPAKPAAAAKKSAAPRKRAAKPAAPAYTPEDIALRAYFVSEHRQKNGLPGDAQSDWLEAERQLRAENGAAQPA
jgi:hypothetical protein